MASSQFDNFGFNSDLYLNPNETDLLIAALDSNKPGQGSSSGASGALTSFAEHSPITNGSSNANGVGQKAVNKQDSPSVLSGSTELDNHPYLHFDTTDGLWDWNLRGLPENFNGDNLDSAIEDRKDSIGSDEDDDADKQLSPEAGDDGDAGEKRKNSDDPDEDDGGGKRQETDPKTGKKQTQRPGRKPLTSEPTTKRKAQNRAAQRAFRERKEKHLKDLETKVEELQKASETANSENSLLKAQIGRLETELKEYRKRLSLSTNGNGGSPTFGSIGQPYSSRVNWDINNNFNFEFPKFGRVTDGTIHSPSINGGSKVASPTSINSNQSNSRMNTSKSVESDLSTLFTPDVLSSANNRSNSNDLTASNLQRNKSTSKSNARPSSGVLPRNSLDSNGASPASSGSNVGLTSSCATTPEATCETPDQQKDNGTSANGAIGGGKFSSPEAFCKDFQTACGNTENPVPLMISNSSNEIPALTPDLTTASQSSTVDLNGFDWLANQNGGAFDPILFGDYREPQENVMNSEFNFFNDAFPALSDFSSPQSQTQTQPLEPRLPPKKDLMQQIEEQQAGKEPEVVPGDERQQFLTCNLLWDRVQKSQRVQSGEADMDDLCTQLKAKAKCSGSGAVISQSDVDAILGPAANQSTEPDFLKMFK